MKFLYAFISVLFLCATNPIVSVKKEITIDEKYKVESTFSGNISGEDSFHLIIAKNTSSKAYDIIPYLYSDGEIKKLKPIAFVNEPNVLSFHNNEGTLSLITKSKEDKSEQIRVLDIDLSTGNSNKSNAFTTDDFKTVIREDNKNILVYADKSTIKVLNAEGAESINEIKVEPEKSAQAFFKELSKVKIDAINTNEYVQNGSINDFRAYSENGVLTLTQENTKEGSTNLLQIPIDSETDIKVGLQEFKGQSLKGGIKKSTSYFSGNKIYKLKLRKDEAKFDMFNLINQTNEKIDLFSTDFQKFVSNKENADSFLKNASKNSNAPTVTINKAENGNVKIRFDYVNKNNYSYRYNWWWHHQFMMQQMMWQQQQMQMRPTGFGPMPFEDIYYSKTSSSHFEIALDVNGNYINPEELITLHKDIDKKSYVEKIDENKKLKYSSTVFTKNTFRYLAYDKSSKSFKIFDETLD